MKSEFQEKCIFLESLFEENLPQNTIDFEEDSEEKCRSIMNRVLPKNSIWMMEEF